MSGTLFRADGGVTLGLGHVMRCLALAEGMAETGVHSTFLLRSGSPESRTFLEGRGVHVEELPAEATWEEDATATVELAKRLDAKILVTDLCSPPVKAQGSALIHYHQRVSPHVFTVCFADPSGLEYPAQVVVSPYAGTPQPTADETGGRILLVGPSYFIFRKEFREAAGVSRSIAPRARRVLVTMGGSDAMGMSARVVEALGALPGAPELVVRLILGPAFPVHTREEVDRVGRAFPGRIDQVSNPEDLAAEMLWADLAITADGGTRYECAVTGTPCVTLGLQSHVGTASRVFAAAGSAVWLEGADALGAAGLGKELAAILEDQELRSSMSTRGRQLVDGRGVERVLAILPLEEGV